ncbi:MAG TPA: hypothetical protein VME46_19540 [Acidimicrobiales bacterium]|nr:hypothetical protein [Acidimicrobiales bacterium]
MEAGHLLAVAEEGTVTGYAFQVRDIQYSIFETHEARRADMSTWVLGESRRALGVRLCPAGATSLLPVVTVRNGSGPKGRRDSQFPSNPQPAHIDRTGPKGYG